MAVLVTNDFPPNHGGIQRFMLRLAQELAKQRDPVVVIAPRIGGYAPFDRSQPYRIRRYINSNRLIGFIGMTVSLLIVRLQDREQCTIASMWFPGGLAACLLPRALRGRFAVLAHGTEIDPHRGGLRRYLMRYVFAQADVIVANSRFTKQLLAQAGITHRVAVVHPGVDGTRIIPLRAEKPTILSVGRLIARKGFDTVIAALPAIIEVLPDAQYIVVGSGPQLAELRALAVRTGVETHVTFLGAVDDATMQAAYASAWCFALPARAIRGDVEGFGVVYLEAAMADLPAVGGAGSGAEDAIIHNVTGMLVDGSSTPEVARALITLLSDPRLLACMGAAGRARAETDFTWRQTAVRIHTLLQA